MGELRTTSAPAAARPAWEPMNPLAPRTEGQEASNSALWHMAVLEHLVKPHQIDLYHFLREDDGFHFTKRVVGISRQWGKSFVAILVAVEFALHQPMAVIKVVAKTAAGLKQFLLPNTRKILACCPPDLMPRYNSIDHIFTFNNGSTITFAGADTMRSVDSLRGPAVDLWVIDEAAFVPSDELKSLVMDVVLPTFIVSKGRAVVMSTPPTVPGHFFVSLVAEAKLSGAYIERDVDSTDATEIEKAEWCREAGGPASDTWLREYKMRFVIDQASLVVPEFMLHEPTVVRPVVPPDRYQHCVTSVDPGFHPDPLGAICGYYDFKRAKVCIQREVVCRGKTTAEQAVAIRGLESAWPPAAPGAQRPWRRVCDINPQWTADMARLHQLHFLPVVKDTLEAMVNQLRLLFSEEAIEIDPACKQLVHQLTTAVWSGRRTHWLRQGSHHNDLLAALVYLVRHPAYRASNPYPGLPEGYDPSRTLVTEPHRLAVQGGSAAVLESLVPRYEY